MTASEHAIISGQLVDARNVGTHKSVRLTVHVPEELALRVFDAFGWPTGTNPVPVAIARLQSPHETSPPVTGSVASSIADNTAAASDRNSSVSGVPARRPFADMAPSQQAGMLSNDIAFQKFLKENYRDLWGHAMSAASQTDSEDWGADAAADVIRVLCQVTSRKHITKDNTEWHSLVLAYRLWMRALEPEHV